MIDFWFEMQSKVDLKHELNIESSASVPAGP